MVRSRVTWTLDVLDVLEVLHIMDVYLGVVSKRDLILKYFKMIDENLELPCFSLLATNYFLGIHISQFHPIPLKFLLYYSTSSINSEPKES